MKKNNTQQIEVQIMGQSYLLACPQEGEAALLNAVKKVDAAMCRIRDAGKVKARDRIAVLAALNIAFDTAASQPPVASEATGLAADAAPAGQPTTDEQRLNQLLTRLNHALAQDGRLI